jgi:hypothetical protein
MRFWKRESRILASLREDLEETSNEKCQIHNLRDFGLNRE